MQDITHYYTASAKYSDKHQVEQKEYPEYSYVYIDVETTAQVPQRPIFSLAFDPQNKKAYIGVDEQKTNILEKMSRAEIKETVEKQIQAEGETVKEIEYYPHISEKYLENLLNDIKKYNEENESKKGISGHNVFFDLGQLTGADEELIIDDTISRDNVDGVLSAGCWSISHKRAGAHGRLYTFRKSLGLDYSIKVADTLTVAKSIYKPSKLDNLVNYYNIQNIKVEDEEHGILNEEYIKYNVNDVLSTMKVNHKMREEIKNTYKVDKPMHYIFSSASIAKEKMKQMNYNRVEYTNQAKNITSKSYFGGQTEALKVSEIIEDVDYTDILSQYPTVSALTDVWSSMQVKKIDIQEIEEQELPDVDLQDLQNKEVWEEISKYYVIAKVNNGTLPVRTDKIKENTRVYKADVESENGIIYHYMDILGSEILDGTTDIEIKKAYKIEEKGEQDLQDVQIGQTKIKADSNLMQNIIEERKRIQYKVNNGSKDENTLAMKVIANSLYGVAAERISEVARDINTNDIIKRYDTSGTYYNPHTASTITAGGRLMLSIGEVIAEKNNGQMYYCDTDSLIIDSKVSADVRNWFNKMNPYNGVAGDLDMLEIEEKEGKKLSNVDLFAIDVKKYAILKDKEILVNKEHGLGHYSNMRDANKISRFWSETMQTLGVSVNERGLDNSERNEIVKWQTSASTYRIRKQLSELESRFVKYADFVYRTIANQDGEEVVYISLNLDKRAIKINLDRNTIETVSSINKNNTKQVGDIVTEWVTRAVQNEDGRPQVRISKTEEVTKESQNIIEAYEQSIEKALNEVDMSYLFE